MVKFVTLLVAQASAAVLELTGAENQIQFQSGASPAAKLSATCSSPAGVRWLSPSSIAGMPSEWPTNMTVELANVPVSCTEVAGPLAETPCVPHYNRMPSLFFCNTHGSAGTHSSVALRPTVEEVNVAGRDMFLAVRLDCPVRVPALHLLLPHLPLERYTQNNHCTSICCLICTGH